MIFFLHREGFTKREEYRFFKFSHPFCFSCPPWGTQLLSQGKELFSIIYIDIDRDDRSRSRSRYRYNLILSYGKNCFPYNCFSATLCSKRPCSYTWKLIIYFSKGLSMMCKIRSSGVWGLGFIFCVCHLLAMKFQLGLQLSCLTFLIWMVMLDIDYC